MNGKLLPILGAGLWILGLILSIVGLNIHSDTGTWLSVIGNILFLVGLGIEGYIWFRRKRDPSAAEGPQDASGKKDSQ